MEFRIAMAVGLIFLAVKFPLWIALYAVGSYILDNMEDEEIEVFDNILNIIINLWTWLWHKVLEVYQGFSKAASDFTESSVAAEHPPLDWAEGTLNEIAPEEDVAFVISKLPTDSLAFNPHTPFTPDDFREIRKELLEISQAPGWSDNVNLHLKNIWQSFDKTVRVA